MSTELHDHRGRIAKSKQYRFAYTCVLIVMTFILLPSISNGADPTLLWKMKFNSRIVKTSRLEDFEVSKGKDRLFPLRAVMTEKSIIVLDSKGKTEKIIVLKEYVKVSMSDNGSTMAGLKDKLIVISSLDEKNNGIINVANSQPVVSPQHISFELSPNGECIVIISRFTHTIYFHSKDGNILAKHHFEDLMGAEIKFSKDSRYMAIHVSNWGEGESRGYLLFFNIKGEKLWRFDHNGCEAKFDISSDGSFIVLAAEGTLYSLDGNCRVFFENPLEPGDIDLELSGDGQYFAITKRKNHSISLWDNQNGNLLWRKNISGFDPINSPFTSLDVSGKRGRVAIVIGKTWVNMNKECYLSILGKSGDLLWHKAFKENKIQSTFSQDGNCLLTAGNTQLYLWEFDQHWCELN